MSEYHSFSLAQHLPSSRSSLRSEQQQQEQYAFHQHTFSIQQTDDVLNCDARHNERNLDDTSASMAMSTATDHKQNNEHDWTYHRQVNSFQNLDAILNDPPNYNHTRHNTVPVTSNDFQPMFDFLPFNDPSSPNLVISGSTHLQSNGSNGDTNTTATPSIGDTLHTATEFNVPIALLKKK